MPVFIVMWKWNVYRYESGDRLTPEHEKTILERLLPYHPEFQKKIGSGLDYITVMLSHSASLSLSLSYKILYIRQKVCFLRNLCAQFIVVCFDLVENQDFPFH